MKTYLYNVFAYNDQDEKLNLFKTNSLEQAVSVACSLYTSSELEFKILNDRSECLVSFVRPL